MNIGTPSWWSPPQAPAHSKVRRPATTAPVDITSCTTCPFTPSRTSAGGPVSPPSSPVRTHSCSRSPPSPRPLSGPSLGPVMKPSRDIDMYRTVADTRAFCPLRSDLNVGSRRRSGCPGLRALHEREPRRGEHENNRHDAERGLDRCRVRQRPDDQWCEEY